MYKKFRLVKIISGLIPVIVLLFVFSSRSYSQINENQNDTITMRTLHNELDTAGDWVKVTKDQIDNGEEGDDDSNYMDSDVNGEYVWVPHYNVDPDWNPYSNGQWMWCDYGWTWVSYYNWGWLPYHYGRWWYSPIWGWVWSPGYTWAPCWVDWYWGYGYVGWYPISPRHHWHWNHGWVVRNHHTWPRDNNYRKWTFVHENDFNKKITKSKLVDPADKKEIFADNEKTNTKDFEKGPNVKDLEKITGEKINAKKIVLASDNQKIVYDPKTIKSKNVDANRKVVKSNTDALRKNPDVRKSSDNTGIKSNNNKSNPNNSEKKSVNKTKTRNRNNTKGSYNTRSSNNNSRSNNNNSSYRPSHNSGNNNNSSNTRSSNSGSNNRSSNSGNNSSRSSNNSGHRR